ncbi:MAG TPA: 2-oxoglutarate ferredoxin oxidoreductase subunit beta, partial [Sporomusa sp.]|nr:2-oxoglutarate ferredoxin oxidoreductase subunit beta [Sporomusa sp.]
MGSAAKMMEWQKEKAIPVQAASKLTPEQLKDKFLIGELHRSEAPEYTAEYDKLIAHVQAKRGNK